MKVLEKGQGWSIKQECTGKGNGEGGCGSTLLVEKEDIYITRSVDMCGDTDFYYTFKCPVCGVKTDVPERDIPSSIKVKAFEKAKMLGYCK